jgi:hypothetical protein
VLDRHVGGLLALENPAGIDAQRAICIGKAAAIALSRSFR